MSDKIFDDLNREAGPPRPREVAGKGRKRARQHRKAYGPYSRIDTVHEARKMHEAFKLMYAITPDMLTPVEKEEE